MPITPAEVRRIASLARLRLDEAEVQAMAKDLASILEHAQALRRAELKGPPLPAGTAPARAPLRDDCSAPDLLLNPPEAFAPAWADGFFVVPRLGALDPERSGPGSSRPDE